MITSGELERLDAALLALRRFTQAPSTTDRGTKSSHGSNRVEISTVLVVDAVARWDPAGDCSIGDVAGALQVAHSTASRFVERAVQVGMIRRGRSSADPRRTVLSLTVAGWRLQREAVGFRTGRLEGLLADWSATDVTAFTTLLERFARRAHLTTEEMPRRSL